MKPRALVPALLLLAACTPAAPPAPGPGAATPPAATPGVRRVEAPGVPEVRYFVLDRSCPYCRDIDRFIRTGDGAKEPALEKVYEGRVRFVFRPAFTETWDPNPEMAVFDFGGSAHGFAGVAADGTVKFTLPGHHHTRSELIAEIDRMLR